MPPIGRSARSTYGGDGAPRPVTPAPRLPREVAAQSPSRRLCRSGDPCGRSWSQGRRSPSPALQRPGGCRLLPPRRSSRRRRGRGWTPLRQRRSTTPPGVLGAVRAAARSGLREGASFKLHELLPTDHELLGGRSPSLHGRDHGGTRAAPDGAAPRLGGCDEPSGRRLASGRSSRRQRRAVKGLITGAAAVIATLVHARPGSGRSSGARVVSTPRRTVLASSDSATGRASAGRGTRRATSALQGTRLDLIRPATRA